MERTKVLLVEGDQRLCKVIALFLGETFELSGFDKLFERYRVSRRPGIAPVCRMPGPPFTEGAP